MAVNLQDRNRISNRHEIINQLKIEINSCRRRLEELWDAKGCTDPEVLIVGDKLDNLLNRYYSLTRGGIF